MRRNRQCQRAKSAPRAGVASRGSGRGFTALVLVAGLFSLGSDPVEVSPRLIIDAPLLSRLQMLADDLSSEVVLCLLGFQDNAMSVVTDFLVPVSRTSTATTVSVAGCPEETIAVWHNHLLPARRAPNREGPRRYAQPPRSPLDLCRLSKRDIETVANSAYRFAVLSVDRDTWCWWSRDQVRRLWLSGRFPGHPVEGQFQGLSEELRTRYN